MSQQFDPLNEYIIGAVERINEINNNLRMRISEEKKEIMRKEKELWKGVASQLKQIEALYKVASPKPRRASRSAKTGKFVTQKQAAANPDTTVTETLSQNHKSQTCPPRRISNRK